MGEYLSYEIFELGNVYQLLVIFHLIGLALGAGAAFYSDFLFTDVLKDHKFDKTEYRILKLTSRVVWLGLFVLTISGLLIFLGNTEDLLDSPKFLAKMTIVGVLTLNGVLFHFYQMPRLKRYVGKGLRGNKDFKDNFAGPFFIGGAVSGVSWVAALVLGSLRTIDLSYYQIMAIYLVVLAVAATVALQVKRKIIG